MRCAKLAPVYLSLAEVLQSLEISNDPGALHLVLERAGGERTEVTLEAAPLPSLLALLDPEADPAGVPGFASARDGATREAPLWLQEPGNRYWFRFLEDSGTAYMRIDAMVDKPEEPQSAFFARVLADMDRLPVKRLVIELRRNNGGNNLALPLIEGIRARPALDKPGQILVIVGRGTVSSGQNLATLLERYTTAVFIGDPTAQRPNHYGAMGRFTLPNSGISVTHSRFLLIDSDPDACALRSCPTSLPGCGRAITQRTAIRHSKPRWRIARLRCRLWPKSWPMRTSPSSQSIRCWRDIESCDRCS
jgi:hypothetical protein